MPALLTLAFLLLASSAAIAQLPAPKDVGADLRSTDAAKRRDAVQKLIYGKGTAQDSALMDAVSAEKEPQLRSELLRAASMRGGDDAVFALIEALAGDRSVVVRLSAAQELGRQSASQEALFSLVDALTLDADPGVRAACAKGLAFRKESAAVQALIEAAADQDALVRAETAFALARQVKSRDIDAALDRLANDQDPRVAQAVLRWRRK
ncbi:MAG: HEAT repeat domain-containing protein [Elusimicrobiota bacterium]|jgi:HEAT repeat protein